MEDKVNKSVKNEELFESNNKCITETSPLVSSGVDLFKDLEGYGGKDPRFRIQISDLQTAPKGILVPFCRMCNFKCKTKVQLNEHLLKHTTTHKECTCNLCEFKKIFKSLENLPEADLSNKRVYSFSYSCTF